MVIKKKWKQKQQHGQCENESFSKSLIPTKGKAHLWWVCEEFHIETQLKLNKFSGQVNNIDIKKMFCFSVNIRINARRDTVYTRQHSISEKSCKSAFLWALLSEL